MSKNKSGVRWYQVIDFRSVLIVLGLFLVAVTQGLISSYTGEEYAKVDLGGVPEWSGAAYVEVADNVPVFTKDEAVRHAFEEYARLDDWDRCRSAFACVSTRLMPKGEAEDISGMKPSGYIGGNGVLLPCRLIGHQLTGENDNERNIITATGYMANEGIAPIEDYVAEHVRETEHFFLYRVQPIFQGDELVCRGVQIEGFCVDCCDAAETEDEKLMFNIFCYNIQPGVQINYLTGEHTSE